MIHKKKELKMGIYKKITMYLNKIFLKKNINSTGDELVNNQVYKCIIRFHFYFKNYFGREGIDLYLNCLIYSLIFLNRLHNIGHIINENNINILLLISIMISSKIHDDIPPDNKFYTKLGGVKLDEINNMEIDFCKKINYKFYVCYEEYKNQIDTLN
jgi:hypothetical protein